MKRLIFLSPISLLITLLTFSFSLNAQTIDASRSIVNFEVENMKVRMVKGSFSSLTGDLRFKPDNIERSAFQVTVPVHSVNTNNVQRDEHLRQADYFDESNYPNIVFVSSFVNQTATGFDVTGSLTIKGITKQVTIPFTYSRLKTGYRLEGNLVLDRFDFNVGKENGFMAGREIKLDIQCYLKD